METPEWDRLFDPAIAAQVFALLPGHEALVHALASGEITSMPNVLLHGPRGFPIDLVWEHALWRRFFGTAHQARFYRQERTFDRQIVYYETPYFIDVDLSSPLHTRSLDAMPGFVHSIIQHPSIHTQRHIFILRHADRLSTRQNRYLFRVLLERFSGSAWFICTTFRLTAIDAPLLSRFWHMRIALPPAETVRAIADLLGARSCPVAPVHARNLARVLVASTGTAGAGTGRRAPPLPSGIPTTAEEVRSAAQNALVNSVPVADLATHLIDLLPPSRQHAFLSYAARIEASSRDGTGAFNIVPYELLLAYAGEIAADAGTKRKG